MNKGNSFPLILKLFFKKWSKNAQQNSQKMHNKVAQKCTILLNESKIYVILKEKRWYNEIDKKGIYSKINR